MATVLTALREQHSGLSKSMMNNTKLLPFVFSGFSPMQPLAASSRPISEIVITDKLILALDSAGACSVFSRDSGLQLLQLTSPLQRIRTLFLNRLQDSVVMVFTREEEQLSRLHCESYDCATLAQGSLRPTALFTEEDLSHPGFVEFDEVNGKVVTRSGNTGVFKLWSLQNYSLCYTLDHKDAEELRITRSLLLLILTPHATQLPLKLLNIETGRLLNAYVLDIIQNRAIELVEQFHEFLLFKQVDECLHILNLLTLSHVKVERFVTPQAFLFLPQQMLFIAIKGGVMDTWSFDGRQIASITTTSPLLTNVPLQHPIKVATCINQQVAILASRPRMPLAALDLNRALPADLLFYDIRSGHCVEEARSESPLPMVTTVHYDEDTHEVYTGHASGLVMRWAN